MINHNGNFPNLDGIENGGLSGLSVQCVMVDWDPLIIIEINLLKYTCCGVHIVAKLPQIVYIIGVQTDISSVLARLNWPGCSGLPA